MAEYAACFARIFVINLDRRPQRWAAILKQLRQAGVPDPCIARFPAVDGTQLDIRKVYSSGLLSKLGYRRLQEPASNRIWGMDLSTGALGCALSHMQLWWTIVALNCHHTAHVLCTQDRHVRENDPVYLVLEDDALLPQDFLHAYTDRTRHVPDDCELLYLGGLDTAHQCRSLSVASGVCRVPQLHRTTSAYTVTARAARGLLELCTPLTYQLDTMMTMNVRIDAPHTPSVSSDVATAALSVPFVHDPCCYTLQPPLVTQDTHFGSDIQDDSQR